MFNCNIVEQREVLEVKYFIAIHPYTLLSFAGHSLSSNFIYTSETSESEKLDY